MVTEGAIAAIAKAAGAIGGTLLALVFLPPKTAREFWQRLIFSIMAGALFGDLVRAVLNLPDVMPMWLASFALTSLASWWAWAAAVRIFGTWKPK